MASTELVAYESEVDSLCGKWVVDVVKELKYCTDVIHKRTADLGKEIERIQIPQNFHEEELKAIPKRIDKILSNDSSRIKHAVWATLTMKVDAKKKVLKYHAHSLNGSVVESP